MAKAEDPTRVTVIAQCCTDEGAADVRHTEAVGFNRYFGWYGGALEDLGPWLDGVHAAHPELAVAISEYGAGASIRHHADAPTLPDPGGTFHPEEYQALVHEAAWRQIADRPYLWGSFVWNMFDFASDGRHEGDRPGINDKGLVTHDRRVRKDAWWWYRVNWSDVPVVYLTGRRHDPRTTPAMDIVVYANTDRVRLKVNDRDLGWLPVIGHIARWTDVALEPGPNRVLAEGDRDGHLVRDTVIWTRVAARRVVLPVVAR